ncbi:MAG TPA: glycosyltransferase [Desulfobulbus sp.]|nr:glycosyltransferase [Desulfobulbus sp.]
MRLKLSIVIPCYNEEKTLEECLRRVLAIADATLSLEVIIVDDCSQDRSLALARELAARHDEIRVLRHEVNMGKGAALRTGFRHATGDVVAVQDADLEYDPHDLKRLVEPIRTGEAEVVLGSRFLSPGRHRVFSFWHYMGNRFLTLLSNMFTDLYLTDMETCYKVFRREVIQAMEIRENRFGFEPEIVARIARRRLEIFEMGISYDSRSYADGKKIGVRDGFRAIYCILHYNGYRAPAPLQFLVYLPIWLVFAILDTIGVGLLGATGLSPLSSLALPFLLASVADYFLCVHFLFRNRRPGRGIALFSGFALAGSVLDILVTRGLLLAGLSFAWARVCVLVLILFYNFFTRRRFIFPAS